MAFIGSFFYLDFLTYLDFQSFNHHREILLQMAEEKTLFLMLCLFLGYLFMAVLSLPGTILLTLFAGFLFGLVKGVILTSLALTIGATITFLFSRFLLRGFFIKKYASRLKTILSDLNKYGIYYLFAMRMVPLVPFFIPNVLMGLTSIKTKHFFIVTYIGLLPDLIIYVNAGRYFSKIEQIKDVFSIGLIASFVLIGFLPLGIKKIISILNKKNKSYINSSELSPELELVNRET